MSPKRAVYRRRYTSKAYLRKLSPAQVRLLRVLVGDVRGQRKVYTSEALQDLASFQGPGVLWHTALALAQKGLIVPHKSALVAHAGMPVDGWRASRDGVEWIISDMWAQERRAVRKNQSTSCGPI